jgi:hypothetical protein
MIFPELSAFLVISTLVVLLVFYGLSQRHNRAVHVPVMMTAFVADVLLVLWIELERHAVEKAASSIDNGLLMFHVAVSLLTLVGYVILAVTGKKMMNGDAAVRQLHQKAFLLFIVCRLSNYVTSFWVV